ncbi:MAG: hypothetical protein IJ594_04995 [Oscillospiraceae bacterium]|nr:hypothetical protein [Oscillospiraceae bacterium]
MMKTRRSMKKALALLLCVVMFVTLLPTFAFADLATPELVTADPDGCGVTVEWNAVTGAAKYRVYRKLPSASKWTKLGDTAATEYRDTTAKASTTYVYTVRCLDSGGKLVSDYDHIGISGAWNESTAGYTDTPPLVSVKAEKYGIRVTWDEVAGAPQYRVFRKASGASKWSTVVDLPSGNDEYLDTTCKSGTKYFYTVRVMNGYGEYISGYNKTGLSATWDASNAVDIPELLYATSEGKGIHIEWNAVTDPGVAAYRVYRKASGATKWSKLADTPNTEYFDYSAKSGTKYSYTVRCLNASGELISKYDTTGVSASWNAKNVGTYAAPILEGVTVDDGCLIFSWTDNGADSYRVYRKSGSSTSWVVAGSDVAAPPFYDYAVQSGTKYTYTVRCLTSGELDSDYNGAGVSATYYKVPELVSAANVDTGIKVTWKAVTGAPAYAVLRVVTGDPWPSDPMDAVIKAGVTGTSYIDTTADAGVSYDYIVCVCTKDGKTLITPCGSSSISGSWVGKTAVDKLTNIVPGVLVEWKNVPAIDTYEVQRKSGTGDWMVIAHVAAPDLYYVDSDVVSATKYTYMLRGYDVEGNLSALYDATGKSITFYAAPTLEKAAHASDGVKVTWEAVEGVTNYRVYRKVGTGEFIKLADVADISYLDTTILSGADAVYTVCCLSADGKTELSAYDPVGVSSEGNVFYDTPLLTGVVPVVGGIKITWQAVSGATQYRVLRKDGTKTSWETAGDLIAGTEFIDADVPNGGTVQNGGRYTYTVVCLDAMGEVASDYNTIGLSTSYYYAPDMAGAENRLTGVLIGWYPVDGIGTYGIYRKTGSGDWTKIATGGKLDKDTSSATYGLYTYTDTTVQSTGTYQYAVSCLVGGADMSAYDKDYAVGSTFYAAPKVTLVENVATGMHVKWSAVDGISKYLVYGKASGDSTYTPLMSVTGTEAYIPVSMLGSNIKFTYTVRCLDSSDNIVSWYNTGVTLLYIATPELVSATSTVAKKATITWGAVDGAKSYDIYRKTLADSGWKRIKAGATGTSYTDASGLTSGVTYYYTVVAKTATGTTAGNRSSWDPNGLPVTIK